MEKPFMHNIEAEQAVLGSILIDPEAILEISDLLAASDFYRDAHKEIYRAMLALLEREEPADTMTLSAYLETHHQLEQVGGDHYITSLVYNVPTSANAEHYAHIVKKKAIFRTLTQAAGKIASLAYEEDETALETAEQLILDISENASSGTDFVPLADIMADLSNEFDKMERYRGAITGIPTGFPGLDRLAHGLQKADLIILGALPRIGKTSIALNMALHAAFEHGHAGAFFSLEMSKKQLGLRMLAQEARIDMQKIRRRALTEEEEDLVADALVRLMDGKIYINDTAGLTIDAIRSKARRLKAKQGIEWVIVDYLQLVQKHIDGKRMRERVQEVAEVARGLKNMAKELDVPVLALAQLNRESEKRLDQVPMLSDLAESSELEKAADIVLFLHRARIDEKRLSDEANLIVEKHRNGPMGVVKLRFEGSQTRFVNVLEENR